MTRHPDPVVGIVLAGGRSSRMGRNKALLDYQGRPLIEHMLALLNRAGCDQLLISGEVPGYPGVADPSPFDGPARALDHVLAYLDGFAGALVVPVDMPFLTPALLHQLRAAGATRCFNQCPLPAFIRLPCARSQARSVGRLLDELGGERIPLPQDRSAAMINLNTPRQWQAAVNHESASRA